MGVCIETAVSQAAVFIFAVTPYMGVCIETVCQIATTNSEALSHPIWVCVLKHPTA